MNGMRKKEKKKVPLRAGVSLSPFVADDSVVLYLSTSTYTPGHAIHKIDAHPTFFFGSQTGGYCWLISKGIDAAETGKRGWLHTITRNSSYTPSELSSRLASYIPGMELQLTSGIDRWGTHYPDIPIYPTTRIPFQHGPPQSPMDLMARVLEYNQQILLYTSVDY